MQISVIIPTFNRALFLSKTINSIINQTYQQTYKVDEIIVVDDGSNDDTKEIVQNLISKYPIIKYIYQENSGVSSARNSGIKIASNEWIAFCDSDDIWLENKIQNQVGFLQANPHILFCHTNEIWLRNGKTIKQKAYHTKVSGDCFVQNLPETLIGASTTLLHKSIFEDIGLFDESLIACEDYDMWLRIARKYEIGLIQEPMIQKIAGHQGQLSFETKELEEYRIKALQKQLQYEKYKDEVQNELKRRLDKIHKIKD
jgi:GT2 family glycosyltransferase